MIHYIGKSVEKTSMVNPTCDAVFNYGYGVYETLRTYNGHVLFTDEHLKRLYESAQAIGIPMNISQKELCEKLLLFVKAEWKVASSELRIRIIVSASDYVFGKETCGNSDVYITSIPLVIPECESCTLQIHEAVRYLPQVKSTSMLACIYTNKLAKLDGFDDALLKCGSELRECSSANIFFEKKGELFTPKKNILEGVTRSVILQLCETAKIKVNLCDVDVSILDECDGAFITKTSVGVLPVERIDAKNFLITALTMKVKKLYDDYLLKLYA